MPRGIARSDVGWSRSRAERLVHRRGRRAAVTALILLAVAALATAGPALASGITNSGDDLRDGWYPEQSSLTPQLVSGGSFGQLWSKSVEGQVYAQPLLSSGTLLVATEANKVYGLDPATGALRWPAPLSLGTPWKPSDIECGDLTPNIGVTATPVIDPTTNTAYLTHKTYASGTSGPARWYMDAIDVATGTEKSGFPVELAGTAQNQSGVTFSPTTQLQRPGLLLMNGVVYAGFGSHCDFSPWQGWVFGVSTAGAIKARWVDLPTGWNGAGIWQSGSGLMSDGSGTLLVSTGNGHGPSTPAPGNSPPSHLGDSVVRLAVQSDGTLKPVDFFAPFDTESLDERDVDFGSGGVTALNNQYFGTPSIPHLAVAVGKEGYVYLLNRDSLGGFKQGSGGGDNVVQRLGPYGGVWSRPGVWPGDGGWVYIPTASGGDTAGGSTGFLRVYQYGVSGGGQPTLSLQASSSDAFGFTSSAPVITSDGTTSGSALVWMIWSPNGSGTGAQLRAYDPVPVGGHPVLRWSAPIGTSAKFATPGVGAGRIYVGTRDGTVLAFGAPEEPPLTGPSTSFPTTTIGSSSQKTVTLTANNSVTVTNLSSSSSQFTVGTPSPGLPAHLSAGQKIEVPVTFTPTQTGLIGGQLTAETDQGNFSFALSGTGQAAAAQLAVSPAVVSFGGTTVGGKLSGGATFRNVGGSPLTINKVNMPVPPFGATDPPKAGSTIAPGASITINVTFEPTAEGDFTGEIGLETTAGNGSIGLTGSAGSEGQKTPLTVESITPDSGPAAGGTPVTITGSGFHEGATVTIGGAASEVEVVSDEEITARTPPGSGTAEVVVSEEGESSTFGPRYTYIPPSSVPDPTAGGWQLNGSSALTATELALTPATSHQAGSAFWPQLIDPRNLTIEFDASIGGGSGADGLTMTLADAGRGALPSSLGSEGGGLGFSGIPGLAVALDEYQNSANPSNNFVGLTDGPASPSNPDLLHWLTTANLAAPLQNATHRVKLVTTGSTVSVFVDSNEALSQSVTLPTSAYLGFTAGTGGLNNRHAVSNLLVRSPAGLTITSVVNAPSGSPQAATKLPFSGECPSSFTTAPLGNGESATPPLAGALSGDGCVVSEAAPTGSGWSTTASVNGGPAVALTASGGQLTVPFFLLVGGANTITLTNTYSEPPGAPVNAPSGSPQAATLPFSGSCPSSLATPLLSGAGPGQGCPPRLTALSETYAVFAVAGSATALTGRTARLHHRGTGFSFTLDQAASVKIAIKTTAVGRRVDGRCSPPSTKLRAKPPCTRTVTIGTLTRTGHAGVNRVAFSGRVGAKALKPGRYRAVFTAVSAGGKSAARSLSFTIEAR